ncbi:MAG: pseudouridine synthase [Candidatus Aminicenantales bacterium]
MNKFLSQAGVASRRHADKLIAEGRVEVNGKVIQRLGYKVDTENDRVAVDGKEVERVEAGIYLMLNKPPGYLVTAEDSFGRPTIKELLPALKARIFTVGRLDFDSRGLLLLTNDGELAYRLSHPRYEVKKTYLISVKGEPQREDIARLEKGIYLEGQKTAPARVILLKGGKRRSFLRVEIHEGRKREVKRMFEATRHPVLELKRIGFGGLELGKLREGKWRFLRKGEVSRLKKLVGL